METRAADNTEEDGGGRGRRRRRRWRRRWRRRKAGGLRVVQEAMSKLFAYAEGGWWYPERCGKGESVTREEEGKAE